MNIEYLSQSEEASFSEMVREESEMATMFAQLMIKLETETDYDTVTVSFSGPYSVRAKVVESPYVVEINDEDRSIDLWISQEHLEDVWDLDGSYDYDEDGLDSVVDTIASRVLTDEEDEDEDWYNYRV